MTSFLQLSSQHQLYVQLGLNQVRKVLHIKCKRWWNEADFVSRCVIKDFIIIQMITTSMLQQIKPKLREWERYSLRPKIQRWGLKMQRSPILLWIWRGAGGERENHKRNTKLSLANKACDKNIVSPFQWKWTRFSLQLRFQQAQSWTLLDHTSLHITMFKRLWHRTNPALKKYAVKIITGKLNGNIDLGHVFSPIWQFK